MLSRVATSLALLAVAAITMAMPDPVPKDTTPTVEALLVAPVMVSAPADTVDAFVSHLTTLEMPVLHTARVTFDHGSRPDSTPVVAIVRTGQRPTSASAERYERPPNRLLT